MSDNPLSTETAASIVARAKGIVMKPNDEWPKIKTEAKSPTQVLLTYALPLIAIGPVCSFIGNILFGYGTVLGVSLRPSMTFALSSAISQFVMSVIGLFVVSFVANFFSPKFGGKDSFPDAFRLVAYAMTAAWIAAAFSLVPLLAILVILGLYSIYLLYTGATPMMDVPKDQAGVFTAVTIVAAIVVNIVLGMVAGALVGGPSVYG